MSVKKLAIICLVWPDGNPIEHPVEVELDNNRTVMALKQLIKAEHAPMLDNIAARDLVLWRCSIPINGDLPKTWENMPFVRTEDFYPLPPEDEISEFFEAGLPRKT